jgi:hypothetical protein
MSIHNKISLYRNYYETTPWASISVLDFASNVMLCDYEAEITELRKATDKATRDKIKAQLPAVTVSGVFSERKNSGLIRHSGYICADFDEKQNPHITDWGQARNRIGSLDEVLFCALSVSARGCFAIIPIAYPDKHVAHFEALQRIFADLGYVCDPTSDVSRLRGLSSDRSATWNEYARPFYRLHSPIKGKATHQPSVTVSPSVTSLIRWVEQSKGFTFAPGSRHNFIKSLVGACHRLNISEEEVTRELIRYAEEDFTDKEIVSIIRSMYSVVAPFGG